MEVVIINRSPIYSVLQSNLCLPNMFVFVAGWQIEFPFNLKYSSSFFSRIVVFVLQGMHHCILPIHIYFPFGENVELNRSKNVFLLVL